ncbi:protein XNDC1N isoform X1 [Calonectris borealis]|uniref:protein XNDC1N isoform X1 n=1 Tax=Calonectris borealis TaxID=1323832 RepID=UPI003F4B108F
MADGPLAPSPRGRYAALPEDYVSRQAPRRSPGPGRGSGTRPGTGPRVGSEGAEARRERRAGTGGIRKEAQSRQRVVSRGSQMAPVKISHVVSFSSQDPKYPVENLLREDGLHPWLGCPQDRSRQLRVELQLERASPIGYVDIGNCGCAFLQIEVGRSSWPLDRPYLTLVPSVALMTPADSKLDQNRCGVRMFKEDFLTLAVGQKWDRLRLTCSQPFSKRGQFGLCFIRVRTPLDPERPQPPPRPSQQGLEDAQPADGPWCSSPAFCWTLFPEPRSSSREEEQLKSRLQQLEPGARSPARLSRPARMVLSAARSRALRPRAGTGTPGGVMRSCRPRTREALRCQGRRRMSLQPPREPAGSRTAGRELPALRAGLCQLPRGSPGQEEEPEPAATERDGPGGVTVEGTAVTGRRASAPSAQAASAWISSPRTPPAAERKTPAQPGLPPRWRRRPPTPGCPAPSASCPSARRRWSGTPAPAGSRQGRRAPWGRAARTAGRGTSPVSRHPGAEAALPRLLEMPDRSPAAACAGGAALLELVVPRQGAWAGAGQGIMSLRRSAGHAGRGAVALVNLWPGWCRDEEATSIPTAGLGGAWGPPWGVGGPHGWGNAGMTGVAAGKE